jgi:hypothetical protein
MHERRKAGREESAQLGNLRPQATGDPIRTDGKSPAKGYYVNYHQKQTGQEFPALVLFGKN